MRQIVRINGSVEFTWLEVADDTWQEELWMKNITESGDTEWILVHTVEYLRESAVETLVSKLEQIGFTAM